MRKPKTLKEQKQNKCKHFNGIMNDACDAGVRYELVTIPNPTGMGKLLPCFKDNGNGCVCDKLEFYTDAEIDAQIEESEGNFKKTMQAREAIVDHLGGPWKKGMAGSRGAIVCPICQGELRFTRSGYNGHIHASCLTPNCVSWIESTTPPLKRAGLVIPSLTDL
jgi:hypothetical protein